jgi:hypothetical protein
MGSRRNKKATAFIKIVRQPNTPMSFFRGRGRLQNVIFKFAFMMVVAYAVYLIKHPEATVQDVFDILTGHGKGVPSKSTRDVHEDDQHGQAENIPDPQLPPFVVDKIYSPFTSCIKT